MRAIDSIPGAAATNAERDSANACMERYASGDDAGFRELYAYVAPRLRAFVFTKTRDPALAEDIAQQTFLQMHRARFGYVPGSGVIPWAFSIARRLIIDDIRKRKHEVVSDDATTRELVAPPYERPDEIVRIMRLSERVERSLARLPKAHREALLLVGAQGVSLVEAAATLGTTIPAVKLRSHRARTTLREMLAGAIDKAA